MDKAHIAHINGDKIQSCKEHCTNTANYAKANLESMGLANTAYLCGLLHDAGKCTEEFNEYIEAAAKGEKVARGSVIHTFAGVRMVLSNYHSKYNSLPKGEEFNNLTAELIAIAIGSHHGQFDVFNRASESGFDHRMDKQPKYDEKAKKNYYAECASPTEIDELFIKSRQEIQDLYMKLIGLVENIDDEKKLEEVLFYLGILERLILSSLIDGDRRDTAEFMSCSFNQTSNYVGFDKIDEHELNEKWNKAYCNLMRKLNLFPAETEIQRARRELSDYCEKFAEEQAGIYRLSLPTGSGKTLSSLRYALAHASKYGKKHIIFAVPLLSILDQNAGVIRDAVGNDEMILEHHSNVLLDDTLQEECARQEFLMETWDSPIIITTLVQLLNTMFDGRTSSIRRFHNLADSVIVIDEVQSVPTKMLSLFNLMLNFLSHICGTTFILCSATQPLFELNSHRLLIDDANVVPPDKMEKYQEIFRRTDVKDIGSLNSEEVIQKLEEYYRDYGSVLLVCNTKKKAYELFKMAKDITDNCIHLSTSMCMAHRKSVLNSLTQMLENKEHLICVSTQLIEAGVDVSFGAVIRLAAGIDNVAQSAGRANRNGESTELAPVGIAFLKGEDLTKLKEIKLSQDVTGELIDEFKKHPEDFGSDLISDKSVDFYYRTLSRKFNNIEGYTEYCVDNYNLFDLLSCNIKFACEEKIITMRQAFKTAGDDFAVFDDKQTSVIVPYEQGRDVINDILSDRFSRDLNWAKDVLKSAKDYMVNIFDCDVERLEENGAVYTDKDKTVIILNPDYYDNELGIIYKKGDVNEWDTLIW